MKFKLNYLLISTIFVLSLAGFTQSQDIGEIKCFVDMLVLHYPYAGQFKLVFRNEEFGFPMYMMPSEENIKNFLEEHPRISDEFKECIKSHKGWFKKILRQKIKLMAIYKKIVYSFTYDHTDNNILPVSEELRGKFHNAQCFIELMVMEGKMKMDSVLTPTFDIENILVAELRNGEIKVGENGSDFLRKCIWENMKSKVKIDEHKILHLNDGNDDDFLKTLKLTPHSEQFIWKIRKELHCVAKHLVENFLVSTRVVFKVHRHRQITAPPTLTRIDQSSHGDLFNKLKECIHRKDVFLKRDDEHDSKEYVDIQAILAQGFVVVSDELKMELDKQSPCLIEFMYSKVGINAFEKVIGLNPDDRLVNNVYKKYVFNKGTSEAFLLRLNMDPESIAFMESDKHVYAEGSEEFMWLTECGVKLTLHENGQNVFNLRRLCGLYNPQEMFLPKIGIEAFKGQETIYKGSDKKGIDAVGTSAAGAAAAAAADGHPNNDECAICLNEFKDGENILNGSCNHISHVDCFQGWPTEMRTTCPICRKDILKMEKVVDMKQNMMVVREH